MYHMNEGGGCSSMVALPEATADGSTIFGKNSDRPLNESQPFCFYPARDYPERAQVECTYIRIPQASHTYACFGSRPYAIFGFEIGVNERGVVIGNEAVYGREIPERRWGLLGMDILRLALERADNAANAVTVMGELLETYGTGGNPATRDQRFNGNYIIADAKDAYRFESMQRCWVAKKIEHVGYLSNCYSIRDDYDRIGRDTLRTAAEKGWTLPGERIDAANCFTRSDLVFADVKSFLRFPRLRYLMEGREPFTPKMMMKNLRDHYEGTPQESLFYGRAAAKVPGVCGHSGGLSGSTSAASAVVVIRADAPEPLRFTYWNSMSPPCCSVFRPFYNIHWLPEDLQHAHALFDERDQWWVFIALERYIALNYDRFAPVVQERFQALEDDFLQEAASLEKFFDGNVEPLRAFSLHASCQSVQLAKDCLNEIKSKLKTTDIDRLLLDYFQLSAEGCGMPYDQRVIR
ncbi:carcinine hydrolase/isopenicillin-N N-acyltransferase family protein [Anaerotruncus rubiinfantis]|uniref:carcinine hydrolase/isopenicillin-N N-acyltransferase family protein n=1 Tax=Anaerotruncus rubiinfantis TaxID=1720200 RepID=UPI00083074DA|nr:C69 family dipeptidase [Anaerotruncus rubiinfantis]